MSFEQSMTSLGAFQTFGDLLKFLRLRSRLTQRELSIAVNYSEAQISRLERNIRPPDPAAIAALFVPALDLEDVPDVVSRLMELAAFARNEEPLYGGNTFTIAQSVQKNVVENIQLVEENLRNNLPLQLTSFVGRQREIEGIKNLLASNPEINRLITLTGSGGCGKTRLALEAARQVIELFPDGIWLIELASVSKPSHVEHKFLSTIGLPEPRDESTTSALTNYLRTKQLLFIVDNCEHVLPKTAILLQEILSACAQVQVLATSREILHVPGEICFNVPAMEITNGVDSESVQLFVERAKTTLPSFSLTKENASHAVVICRRLEGIPLAIELAAAQVSLLTVPQIASLLETDFQLLIGGSTIPERHRTMEATIKWSYELLSEAERALLRRLSIFSGGWTLEAAQSVASDPTLVPPKRVLYLLSQLVNKSLVIVNWDSPSEARYDMLQTVVEFAQAKLLSSGEFEKLCEQHFEYFCSTALQREQDLLKGKRTIDWAEVEIDNLRALFSWALSLEIEESSSNEYTGKAMELMSHVHLLWLARGFYSEGKEWLEQLLAVHTVETHFRARALILASVFARYAGDHTRQLALIQESLSISKQLNDRKYLAWSFCWIGLAESDRHNYDQAILYLSDSLEILVELNEKIWITYATYFLAEAYMMIGELEAAESYWNQGIDICREQEYSWHSTWGKDGLGHLKRHEGDFESANKEFARSLDTKKALKDTSGIASSFENFALLASDQHQFRRAAILLGAAERLRRRLQHSRTHIHKSTAAVDAVRSQLGEECFQSTRDEGWGMSIEQAIDFALGK
jgi:predicted ATPase/transcriptional regulator with XRE-family HTH domain